MKRSLGCAIPSLLVLLLASALPGCAVNPVSGKRELSLVSTSQEVAMGQQGDQAVVAEFGAYGDSTVQRYVDRVGQRLARVSHRPDLSWHFRVLDSPVVNAFALPGGYIYITRGILAYLNSEAQLAGVLGHEIGHVTARHGAEAVTRQQLAGLGLGLAGVFFPGFQRYGAVAQQGMALLFLKYSRDNENQADELGVHYSVQAGFDPREIPATYTTLKRIGERSGQRLPGFLSTHPDPGDREQRTGALAQTAVQGVQGQLVVDEPGYKSRLEGLVWGDDPRGGYFIGTRFHHPDLRFQLQFPAGWQTQNGPAAVVAVEPKERAAMQLTLASAEASETPSAYTRRLLAEGKVSDAQGSAERLAVGDAWVGRLLVRASDGNTAVLLATIVRLPQGPLLQILGKTALADDPITSQIYSSMRGISRLTDPAYLQVSPARVTVLAVTRSASLSTLVAEHAPLAIDAEEVAVLNNLPSGARVERGHRLKLARKGSLPER